MSAVVIFVFLFRCLSQVQMLHAVGDRKRMQEILLGKKFTQEQVLVEWNENLVITSGEAINAGYVKSAMNVWDNLMSKKELRNQLVEA